MVPGPFHWTICDKDSLDIGFCLQTSENGCHWRRPWIWWCGMCLLICVFHFDFFTWYYVVNLHNCTFHWENKVCWISLLWRSMHCKFLNFIDILLIKFPRSPIKCTLTVFQNVIILAREHSLPLLVSEAPVCHIPPNRSFQLKTENCFTSLCIDCIRIASF
jgi:hypothetical protein